MTTLPPPWRLTSLHPLVVVEPGTPALTRMAQYLMHTARKGAKTGLKSSISNQSRPNLILLLGLTVCQFFLFRFSLSPFDQYSCLSLTVFIWPLFITYYMQQRQQQMNNSLTCGLVHFIESCIIQQHAIDQQTLLLKDVQTGRGEFCPKKMFERGRKLGLTSQLRGFVCAYHPAQDGFESQTNHVVFNLYVWLKLTL